MFGDAFDGVCELYGIVILYSRTSNSLANGSLWPVRWACVKIRNGFVSNALEQRYVVSEGLTKSMNE